MREILPPDLAQAGVDVVPVAVSILWGGGDFHQFTVLCYRNM